jgi:protein disulfide-isomerase A1
VQVIFLDPAENEGAMQFFGASKDETPCLMVHEPKSNGKYNSGKLEVPKMAPWVSDYLAGKIEKTIKSEEPPATNDAPVKIVTAKTFDELVFSGKNVLIEFYAPWCGHCKKLAPVWDKLGEAYKNESGLTIAKMDATANDVPSDKFEVSGFPTIMFVTKDGKVEKYSGGRELADFQKFLAEHAGVQGLSPEADGKTGEEKKDEL